MTDPYDIFGPGGFMERATDIGPPATRSDLTPTMQAAYDYARANGGTLTRFPGGFQQPVQWMRADRSTSCVCGAGQGRVGTYGVFFGTSTIEGLVRRKYAVYTKWQEGRRGKFPIEVTMIQNQEDSHVHD